MSEMGGRAMYMDAESRPIYCARFSLSFLLAPKRRIDQAILKPECLQVRRLSAIFWLMSFFSEIELYYTPAEALGHLAEVAEWDVVEITVFIKAALLEDSMEVGVPA